MGKATGIAKHLSGKIGNLVFKKQKDGTTNVSEVQKPSEKPLTDKQLAVLQDTKITSNFIKCIEEFINIGYELLAKSKNQNQNNAVASYVRKNTLTGVYPERRVDLSKVLVAQGKMEVPEDAAVEVTEKGFSFTWKAKINAGMHYSDQVMLMAYFPDLMEARCKTAGAERRVGKDLLDLDGIEKGYVAHLYIAFIKNDRKSISNSVYLGQLSW